MFPMKKKQLVRIKANVKGSDGIISQATRRCCIDPEITSFDMLQGLLARLFAFRSEFTIFYVAEAVPGEGPTLQSMLNDWDLDAALVSLRKPFLQLLLSPKPVDHSLEDWDIVTPLDVTDIQYHQQETRSSFQFLESLGKALGGLKSKKEVYKLSKSPMSEAEFKHYMDSEGRLISPAEFRSSVYLGGIEASLRKTAWPHLLNIFPEDMTGRERVDYMKRKQDEYLRLRDDWLEKVKVGTAGDEVRFVTGMVKKDVVRTDRIHPFYAGSDENRHVVGLFHILVTYAVHHPDASYCQGMSDIASPLYVVLGDEANAYACFCSLMRRLRSNFALDGIAMTTKFEHLGTLLERYDEEFYAYLHNNEADDLFFTYRWLLLELKREFPFDDALLILEIMWSTLPADAPLAELDLADPPRRRTVAVLPLAPILSPPASVGTQPLATTPLTIVGSHSSSYSRLRLSRRSSSGKFVCSPPMLDENQPPTIESSGDFTASDNEGDEDVNDDVCDGTFEKMLVAQLTHTVATIDHSLCSYETGAATSISRVIEVCECAHSTVCACEPTLIDCRASGENESLDKICDVCSSASDDTKSNDTIRGSCATFRPIGGCPDVNGSDIVEQWPRSVFYVPLEECSSCQSQFYVNLPHSDVAGSGESDPGATSGERSRQPSGSNRSVESSSDHASQSSFDSGIRSHPSTPPFFLARRQSFAPENFGEGPLCNLPPPSEFGAGNPFLMFAAITLILQHRDNIMSSRMDFNDIVILFDKMVRKNDVRKVLVKSQALYDTYVKEQELKDENGDFNFSFSI